MAHLLSPLRGLVETDIFPALTRWANEFRPPGFGWNSRRKMEFPDWIRRGKLDSLWLSCRVSTKTGAAVTH